MPARTHPSFGCAQLCPPRLAETRLWETPSSPGVVWAAHTGGLGGGLEMLAEACMLRALPHHRQQSCIHLQSSSASSFSLAGAGAGLGATAILSHPWSRHQASHTRHGESRDHLIAQMRQGAPQPHCRSSSQPLRDPQVPAPSLPRTVIFIMAAAHFSGPTFPWGHGEKSFTLSPLFFAVLVSIIVGGDWVSWSAPRSQMLGLAVYPASCCLRAERTRRGEQS